MPEEYTVIKERVNRLRTVHLEAMSSFRIYEELLEYKAPNIHGRELAHQQVLAITPYKGFFNIVERALNTSVHLNVAKLFDSHRDALHIERLVNYAEQNRTTLTAAQIAQLDSDRRFSAELTAVYEGLSREDLLEIRDELNQSSDKIRRLKEIRDKEVAHIDVTRPQELEYLSYQEFIDLLSLSEKILNTVSRRVYGDVAWFESYIEEVTEGTQGVLRLVSRSHGIIDVPRH